MAAATAELQAAKLAVQLRTLEIEKLKLQIAKLRRMQFGSAHLALSNLVRHIVMKPAPALGGDIRLTGTDLLSQLA